MGVCGIFYFGNLLADLERETLILRVVTERFMVERPDSWEFGSDRLLARLEPYLEGKSSLRIETLAGEIVAERAASPGSKLITQRNKIELFGQPAGYIEVGIDLWTPILVAIAVFLLGLGLGVLLTNLLRMRPLNVLRETHFSMQQTQDHLQRMNDRLESIREDERTHVAREIHDEIGQQLTAMKFETVGLLHAAGRVDDQKRLGSMFDHAIQTIRNIAWQLRPPILDTLGLEAALIALGQDFQRRAATRCRVDVPEKPLAIDNQAVTNIFRICQELLTNVQRHAIASSVDIRLTGGPPVMLEVTDNGVGIKPEALDGKSLGLLGINERARRMGATVNIETVPAFKGTRVRIIMRMDYKKLAEGSAQ